MGKAARYFPTPYWSDPSRQSVHAMQDAGTSLLAKFERTTVANAFATLRENAMDLCIPGSFATILASRTEDRVPSAILPGREPGISAALVWTPGQSEPEAIFAMGPPPTAVAATFVALIPNDAAEDDIRFMEDGYVVLLSTESAQRLVIDLRAAAPVELRGREQERTLRIAVKRSS